MEAKGLFLGEKALRKWIPHVVKHAPQKVAGEGKQGKRAHGIRRRRDHNGSACIGHLIANWKDDNTEGGRLTPASHASSSAGSRVLGRGSSMTNGRFGHPIVTILFVNQSTCVMSSQETATGNVNDTKDV